MEDQYDTHMCLACRSYITGLDNYISHVKICSARQKAILQKSEATQQLVINNGLQPNQSTYSESQGTISDLASPELNNCLSLSSYQNILQGFDNSSTSRESTNQHHHEDNYNVNVQQITTIHTINHTTSRPFFNSHLSEHLEAQNIDDDNIEPFVANDLRHESSSTSNKRLSNPHISWSKADYKLLNETPIKSTSAPSDMEDVPVDAGFEDFFSFLGLQTSQAKSVMSSNDLDFMASKKDLDAISADAKKGVQIAQLLSQWDLSSMSSSDEEEVISASDSQNSSYDKRPKKLPTGAKWKPGMLQKKVKKKSNTLKNDSVNKNLSSRPYNTRMERKRSEKMLELDCEPKKVKPKLNVVTKKVDFEEQQNALDNTEIEHSPLTEVTFECKTCNKTFSSPTKFDRHTNSQQHLKTVVKSCKNNVTNKSNSLSSLTCPSCNKTFCNKQSLIKHLLSIYHKRRINGDNGSKVEQLELARALLLVRPYQCRICNFYVAEKEEFMSHIQTEEHVALVSPLVGSLWCRQCKCSCSNNDDLINHFNIIQHSNETPWCVREKRSNVVCRLCGKEEHSANRLQYHMKVHHQPDKKKPRKRHSKITLAMSTLECDICGKMLFSVASLEGHMKRFHADKDQKPFSCQFCDVSFFDTNALKSHERSIKHLNRMVELGGKHVTTDSSKPHIVKCVFCAFRTEKNIELNSHYVNVHKDLVAECVPCGIVFISRDPWEKHMTTVRHQNREEQFGRYQAGLCSKQSCDECGLNFYTNLEFRMHQMSHHTILSDSLMAKKMGGGAFFGIDIRYHSYLRQQPKANTARIACPACGKVLQRQYLLHHLRNHSGNMPFTCVKCQAKFSCSMSLKRHIKMLHVARTSVVCEHCGRSYSNRLKLSLHKIRMHKDQTTVKAYKCDKCDKVFVQPCQLKFHALIHGEKNFHCTWPNCPRAFRSQSEVQMHLRVHTDERPYLCEQCSYAAKTRQQLVRHQRTHTNDRRYNCEYCDYKVKS